MGALLHLIDLPIQARPRLPGLGQSGLPLLLLLLGYSELLVRLEKFLLRLEEFVLENGDCSQPPLVT